MFIMSREMEHVFSFKQKVYILVLEIWKKHLGVGMLLTLKTKRRSS